MSGTSGTNKLAEFIFSFIDFVTVLTWRKEKIKSLKCFT